MAQAVQFPASGNVLAQVLTRFAWSKERRSTHPNGGDGGSPLATHDATRCGAWAIAPNSSRSAFLEPQRDLRHASLDAARLSIRTSHNAAEKQRHSPTHMLFMSGKALSTQRSEKKRKRPVLKRDAGLQLSSSATEGENEADKSSLGTRGEPGEAGRTSSSPCATLQLAFCRHHSSEAVWSLRMDRGQIPNGTCCSAAAGAARRQLRVPSYMGLHHNRGSVLLAVQLHLPISSLAS